MNNKFITEPDISLFAKIDFNCSTIFSIEWLMMPSLVTLTIVAMISKFHGHTLIELFFPLVDIEKMMLSFVVRKLEFHFVNKTIAVG